MVGRLEMLGRPADDNSLKQVIPLAEHASLGDRHMAYQPAAIAYSYAILDDAKRADFYARREFGGGADNRKRMDRHAR